ncbi:hypothetical protein TKK_0015948 [Trichogramma kaykai]|uniref:DUF7041 domain-containing protein n=1 Tax=Trichogramma kaykai TaxID=54128 RepID=A0ABD2W8I1_9HYME
MENLRQTFDREGRPFMTSEFPRFWRIDPKIWLEQVEAFFICAGIRSDSAKYLTFVANAHHTILLHVADLIENPPQSHKYMAIKKRICDVFCKDILEKLSEIFEDNIYECKRPSELLTTLKNYASSKCTENDIKGLVLRKMHRIFQYEFEKVEDLKTLGEKLDDAVRRETVERVFPDTPEQFARTSKDFHLMQIKNAITAMQ